MKKLINFYNKLEEYILVVGIVLMVIILFMQVVLRFFTGNPWVWGEELSRIIFVWVSWLGISIGQKHGEHIKVTMVTDRLKGNKQKIVLIIADIVSLVILAFFLYYGIIIVDTIFKMGTSTPALKIPRWTIYLSVPVSCLAMCIRLISDIVNNIKSSRGGAEICQ